MRWIYLYLGLFLCCYEVAAVDLYRSKRGVDLAQDDWPDDRPGAAEIDKIIRDYKENRLLISGIPSRFYEVIYPVQLRQHEKVGISTRDVGANKTGKHFHRTSLLIKAFNHKFQLDLELNTNLLAPNLIQKHFLPGDLQQFTSQGTILERLFKQPYTQLEIEHCYYHGTIKDHPGAFAAFRTCNGVSGIIHFGNETFVIHPFHGGDLSKKHPHVIYEVKNKMKQACGNTRNLEWGFLHFRKHDEGDKRRYKRDVREVTKYVELALVVDKSMFTKRNTTDRVQVVHDAIQIVNIVDLTWGDGDQSVVSSDVRSTLMTFMEYCSRKLYKVYKDSTQLLTGLELRGGEAGMAVPDSICTTKAVGVSKDINIYEPHLVAVVMAHAIGHNMGMAHDDSKCQCPDWHGCIMAESIVGSETVQPYRFSTCSVKNYVSSLRVGNGICLFNKPNQLEDFKLCGNGIVDTGEDCDCGTIVECPTKDPCCDPITCRLKSEAECSTGPCCDKCKLRHGGYLCRNSATECDIPETCDGKMGRCPADTYKKNGTPCNERKSYCFAGKCHTRDSQCDYIWGGGKAADDKCFEQFNQQGSFIGNCGLDANKNFKKCEPENVKCGSLQCKAGARIPIVQGLSKHHTRTIVSAGGDEYECKVTSGSLQGSQDLGLVQDGTKCGDDKVCFNQSCLSIKKFIQSGRCESNNVALICSGHGVCSNVNTCFCDSGWIGGDCAQRSNRSSIQVPSTTSPITSLPGPSDAPTTETGMSEKISNWQQTTTKNISYESFRASNTLAMVITMVSVVGGVFVAFAVLAICYRRRSMLPRYDPPYMKKPAVRKIPVKVGNKDKDDETSIENANRIITFGSMPSYRYRPDEKASDSKRRLKREQADAEDETVSFIELPPNNLSKQPEKGILKHSGKGESDSEKEKWCDEMSQSDNQEVLSQSDVAGDIRRSDALTEVERTLKSMNGYHEDILEALRNAASHRGSSVGGSGGANLSQTSLTVEEVRKSLSDLGSMGLMHMSSKGGGSGDKLEDSGDQMDDTVVPPCAPIRIRNLEDLIRQLERHPSRHMSPSGSEDIRFSETEADRHYRSLERHRHHQGGGGGVEVGGGPDMSQDSRFVFGRFRQPTTHKGSMHGSEVMEGSSGQRGMEGYQRQQQQHQRGLHSTFKESEMEAGGEPEEEEEVENGEFICKHMVVMRSASEEALGLKRDTFERNLNSGHHEKSIKGGGGGGQSSYDYFPSPPSEDSYPDSYDENVPASAAAFPAPSVSSGSNDQVYVGGLQQQQQGASDHRTPLSKGSTLKYKEYAH